jgi:hypothetical protein
MFDMALRRILLALLLAGGLPAAHARADQQPAAQPTPQQRAAMLKQWLQASQAQLRAYEWIESTTVSVGGEVRSHLQKRCYYGADGVLQKVPVGADTAATQGPRGPLRKRIAENRKEELSEYMKSAVELVHAYVPPDPAAVQAAIQGGRLGVQVLEPGRRIRLDFTDFRTPGDRLGVEIEMPTNRLLGLNVQSHLKTPADAIALAVTMSVLPDGTIFAQRSQLDAPAEKISVVVENSGYRRMTQ